jgi:hypothetical protein
VLLGTILLVEVMISNSVCLGRYLNRLNLSVEESSVGVDGWYGPRDKEARLVNDGDPKAEVCPGDGDKDRREGDENKLDFTDDIKEEEDLKLTVDVP